MPCVKSLPRPGPGQIRSKAKAGRAVFGGATKSHRWALLRHLVGARRVLVVMANPSYADGIFNDRSVAKCERWAVRDGFDMLYVGNAFGWRDRHPEGLKVAVAAGANVIGGSNDRWLADMAQKSDEIWCAWSNIALLQNRHAALCALFAPFADRTFAFKINKSGTPAHPLRLPEATRPFRWTPHI